MTRRQAARIINRSLRRRNEIVSERYAKRLMEACAVIKGESQKDNETVSLLTEGEK